MDETKKIQPTEWYAKNNLYCRNSPKIITRLTSKLIDKMIRGYDLTDYRIVQIILIKFCD